MIHLQTRWKRTLEWRGDEQSDLPDGSILSKKIVHIFGGNFERQILHEEDSVHLLGKPLLCRFIEKLVLVLNSNVWIGK
jgi:hypothetical protein